MCLYPKLILNRKYLPNKKNGGIPPKCPVTIRRRVVNAMNAENKRQEGGL